ncbi:metalloregulator ArsR/SmtB family transcription factor [Corynebacterium sp. SCR221107]|uniref:ArsR/SmtB family transcription factor n=1 Tax=Corynebacterium sp. SCR221107 TaxID=3017361 RepID=UPI0022EC8404|nr:metalloregulator ArsR/SmtB family transcription factor [Corynebacterium sp. SCR221107]WBT09064.1 metalloregulator ArsR/SmtB family transcription factor [Corynebacterium sp. SCR221107]
MTEQHFPTTIPIQAVGEPATECCMGTHILTPEEAQRFSTQLKALADPTRLLLISHIADRRCEPLTVTQLTALSGLTQSTVSHHLKKLTDAGLIRKQRQGLEVLHYIEEDQFRTLCSLLNLR